MASEEGESTSSAEMLTPEVSVSETADPTLATQQPLSDRSLACLPDDLSRGRHLWQRAKEANWDDSLPPNELNLSGWLIPSREGVPDETGK